MTPDEKTAVMDDLRDVYVDAMGLYLMAKGVVADGVEPASHMQPLIDTAHRVSLSVEKVRNLIDRHA